MSKTRMGKRIASLLLSLVMMLSLLPTTVYAAAGTADENGVSVVGSTAHDTAQEEGVDNAAAGEGENGDVGEDGGDAADVAKIGETGYATLAGAKVFEPKATASAVATTKDGREYATLTEALAAVTESNPLTSVTEEAWPAATPVYYNGSFYATIGELLYDAQQKTGAIAPENAPDTAVIYCRPGTTIPTGKASHPSFVTSTTIYGNGATLSGVTEWDVENYYTLTKDITINLYSLNGGASVWGTRRSDYAVTVNMVDCKDAHEVLFNYGSGNGRVDVTVKDSTFLKSGGAAHGWPVSINCLGSLLVDGCTFDGVTTGVVVNVKQPSENGKMDVTVKNSTFNNVTGQDSNKGALRVTGQQACDIDLTIENVAFTGTHADPEDITIGNVKSAENLGKVSYNISGTDASMTTHKAGATEATKETLVSGTTYTGTNAATAAGDGTEANPYTLEQLGAMTRQEYIDAQNRLNGIMYVTVGDYAYDTNGVLGNGVRDDTTGQTPDHSKLNAYGENGYLGEKNDGANGRSVVFVGGSITSGVTGYTSIDKIGTSLLLALPAYTNVTFKGTTFNNVMSFNYQLYTSPWSQLGELKFDGCTFNGIIVGAIAAQTLTFNGCEFKNYTNTTYANSSNPTWIRPAYGNWTQGDNEGQGSDFRSLTTINFTDNKVTSTRPVKFEYISQWNITSTVTATGNSFDISKQDGDTTIKNVGLYLGAHTDANAFNLVAENNTKSENTAALYTIPEGKTSLPLGSTVKNLAGEPVELTDALKWKAGDAKADKIVLKTVEAVASVGSKQYGSLQAAIDAATAGQTVTLLTNLDLSATGLTIAANKDVTLDLNGKTLKVANTNSGNIKVVGKLTLQDSTDTAKNGTGTGKVWTETPYISGKQDKVLVAAIDGGTFIMESGLIDAASFTADNTNEGQFAVSVQNKNADATVIINGGCIKAGWYAIAGNGQVTTYNGNITVNGGILESTADYAIYHPHSGTTTINGGVVFGAVGGVSLNRGKLIVNNGIITSKGTGTTGDWGDGTGNQNAAAINVNAQYGLASVEIKGGKITAEKDAILLTNGKDGTISVSGGTFSSEVPAEYCAEGFIPTANADGTYGVELGNYVVVGGIKGFENTKFASFADAYDAIKPVLEKICANDPLGEGTPANAAAFDAVFTDVKDGRATLTYTITGNVTYDETGYANLLTMGRRSSHYLTNERHLINFKFVGAEAERGATLTVNSNITLPYEWWGEKITTAISFENLTITGSASNGLYTYQPYFEGIDFTVNNCTLKGIKIYNCANVGGSYTITNSTLDGTGAPAGAYAIHLQGNETAPLSITINGNQISGYDRGINIDQKTAVATISGNTIGINDENRSCIQLTQLASTKVKDNTLNLNGGNAFTLHSGLAAGSKIDIAGNTVDGNGYLIYDDTKNAIDLTYTDNTVASTVDTTKGVYGGATKALTDGVDVVINGVKAAQIGDVKYDTLQEAIDAVKANETIYVLGNIDLGTDELSTSDVKTTVKNVTIDLGGYTVTSAGKYTVYLKVNGWTIQNGTIQNTNASTTYGTLYVGGSYNSTTLKNLTVESATNGVYFAIASSKNGIKASITVEDGTKISGNYGVYMKGQPKPYGSTRDGQEILNVNGGEITGTTAAIAVFGAAKGNTKAGVIVNINGGKVYSDSYAIAGNGSPVLENTTIKISGGKVFSNKDTAIYHPQAGAVTISGGEVYGVTGGVQMCAGTLNVTGGTISATGNGDVSGKTGDGSIPDGAAVSIVNRAYPAGAPTMTISGGTFTSAAGVGAVQAYGWKNNSQQTWDKPNAAVSGGTFSSAVKEEYCATGYIPTANADGNYTVEEYKPVEVWTGYSGAKVASYATVAEAAEKLDGNKWIVIGKDYTLTEDFTIGGENLANLYLDVAEGATLTVAEGVTLTVAANAKRLGVRDGATLVNKGTIVVRGSSTSNGFAMLYGTFTGNELTVPEGCFLDNNGKNFFATANAEASFEIAYSDGTTKKAKSLTNLAGATKVTLLKDVTDFARSFGSTDKLSDNFVLDLGGHTLSGKPNASGPVLDISVPMTIQNGTIKNVSENKPPKANPGALTTSADVTIAKDAIIDGGSVGYAIWTDGYGHTLTVNGKVTSEGSYAITSNGSENGGLIAECNIIVNEGASITAPKGIAIYHPEKGTVTINGGTITGHTGIEMCAGQLVVNGGSITSNGDNMDATGSQNAILDGAAISIINRNYPGGVPTAVIKGGTFAANGKDAQTVKAYDYTGDKVAEWTAAGDNVNISGGTFSSIPTNMGVLCADGYKTVYDAYADMYNVVKQDAKITVGKRLSIGNDLTITYLVSLTDCTNLWVKFQFYNDDIKGYTTVEVKNYGTDTVTGPDGQPMDVFTFDFTGINPQRMTDTLKATVYAKDANGNVVEYQVDDYSVAQYCSNKLAKLGQNDPLRKLIGNLVAYGAAAQVYQNYRTDNLVSTVVSGAVSTDYTDRLSSVTQYTEKVLGTAGVNIKGKTLVLSNTFAVRVYFTVNEGVDIANVSFNVTANGKTDTVNSFEKDEKLGYYYFDYANLNATQLDSEVKFESFVNEPGVGDMVTYSVNTYLAKKMPNYDKSSNAYKLMAELFNYGCACTEYASK